MSTTSKTLFVLALSIILPKNIESERVGNLRGLFDNLILHNNTNSSMAEVSPLIPCGEESPDYEPIALSSIGSDMDGQKVMITWNLRNSELARCTRMACTDEFPCCNICDGNPFFNKIALVPTSEEDQLGCYGNDCDWQDNCIYSDNDIVTVYGEVKNGGKEISIHAHCLGKDIKCEMSANLCPENFSCVAENESGYGTCVKKLTETKDCLDDCDPAPSLVVDDPFVSNSYSPYEKIRVCLNNTLSSDIYLPGCTVFDLFEGRKMYSESNCLWEGNAIRLEPGDVYCSKYVLFFGSEGEYHIQTKYGLDCSTSKMLSECKKVKELKSGNLFVDCPESVDCMPIVQEPLWKICSGKPDDFPNICPDTDRWQ